MPHGAAVDGDPAHIGCGRVIARIDIGAKIMPGDAGCCLDRQDVFSWQALGALQPFPNGGGGHIADARQLGLGAKFLDAAGESFVWGKWINHICFNGNHSCHCQQPDLSVRWQLKLRLLFG